MKRLAIAAFVLCWISSAGANLVVYGIEDPAQTASQMFTLDITTSTLTLMGPVYDLADIEGITWRGTSIVGHTGEHEGAHEYIELFYGTGTYSVLGPVDTGPDSPEFTGLATDLSGTVWCFLEDVGFGTVDILGAFTLVLATTLPIEGVAVAPDGHALYGIRDDGRLYEVLLGSGTIVEIADFDSSSDIENLEMVSATQVAFFTTDGAGVAYNTFDIATGGFDTIFLPGVDLGDIETFIFAEQEVATEDKSWGEVKSLY